MQRTELGASLAEDMNQLRVDRLSHSLGQWTADELDSLARLTGRLNRALADNLQDDTSE